QTEAPASTGANDAEQQLIRGVGLWGATTLNMIDMIGVGPFITIPLIIAAMGGPQAMLGWILGALLVMCDGLVWAELGAALPDSPHCAPTLVFVYPPGAFSLRPELITALGAAMLVYVYDYWGYYNVCFVGGEVKDPSRTIPRAVLLSILFVAIIYIVMNISLLGVIPWREFAGRANTPAQRYVICSFMVRLYGPRSGLLAAALIRWTAF